MNVSPASGSVADNVPMVVPVGTFSEIEDELKLIFVGDSLRFKIGTVNVPSYVNPPASVVLTLIEYEFLDS